MAKILTDDVHYHDIANAIRAMNGTTLSYTPSEMASAIMGIEPGEGVDIGMVIAGKLLASADPCPAPSVVDGAFRSYPLQVANFVARPASTGTATRLSASWTVVPACLRRFARFRLMSSGAVKPRVRGQPAALASGCPSSRLLPRPMAAGWKQATGRTAVRRWRSSFRHSLNKPVGRSLVYCFTTIGR